MTKPVEERWRVFCSIDLSARPRGTIVSHINRLREQVPQAQASWSRAENIHLTLKFLGDVAISRVVNLSNAAARAVVDCPSFQIIFRDSGAFPARGAPRVLWIGVKDESGKLAELNQRLEDACAQEGFPREERAFHPHLTIARLRKPQGARTLSAVHKQMPFEPVAADIQDLLVIRSEPGGSGSKYTVVSRHQLGS